MRFPVNYTICTLVTFDKVTDRDVVKFSYKRLFLSEIAYFAGELTSSRVD